MNVCSVGRRFYLNHYCKNLRGTKQEDIATDIPPISMRNKHILKNKVVENKKGVK